MTEGWRWVYGPHDPTRLCKLCFPENRLGPTRTLGTVILHRMGGGTVWHELAAPESTFSKCGKAYVT